MKTVTLDYDIYNKESRCLFRFAAMIDKLKKGDFDGVDLLLYRSSEVSDEIFRGQLCALESLKELIKELTQET